jgi:hypothetical protein
MASSGVSSSSARPARRHGRRRDDLTRDKEARPRGRPGLPYQRGDRRERSPGSD